MPSDYFGVVVAGEVFCCVLYEMAHYYIHHALPTDAYFKDLKRYHMLHHYKQGTVGFGVSNKFWDVVFGTLIKY